MASSLWARHSVQSSTSSIASNGSGGRRWPSENAGPAATAATAGPLQNRVTRMLTVNYVSPYAQSGRIPPHHAALTAKREAGLDVTAVGPRKRPALGDVTNYHHSQHPGLDTAALHKASPWRSKPAPEAARARYAGALPIDVSSHSTYSPLGSSLGASASHVETASQPLARSATGTTAAATAAARQIVKSRQAALARAKALATRPKRVSPSPASAPVVAAPSSMGSASLPSYEADLRREPERPVAYSSNSYREAESTSSHRQAAPRHLVDTTVASSRAGSWRSPRSSIGSVDSHAPAATSPTSLLLASLAHHTAPSIPHSAPVHAPSRGYGDSEAHRRGHVASPVNWLPHRDSGYGSDIGDDNRPRKVMALGSADTTTAFFSSNRTAASASATATAVAHPPPSAARSVTMESLSAVSVQTSPVGTSQTVRLLDQATHAPLKGLMARTRPPGALSASVLRQPKRLATATVTGAPALTASLKARTGATAAAPAATTASAPAAARGSVASRVPRPLTTDRHALPAARLKPALQHPSRRLSRISATATAASAALVAASASAAAAVATMTTAAAAAPTVLETISFRVVDAAPAHYTAEQAMCMDYEQDIVAHWNTLEKQFYVSHEAMTTAQKDVQPHMRATLVDWIVQVHDRFRLLPETLFLSVQLMDRFLGQHRVAIPKLQLVGITSLWVASKYEEIQVPTLAHLDYMCDGTYPPSEFVKAESFLLMTLRYELGGPNPLLYLRRIARADVGDARRARHMAKYYLEVALMHLTMLQWRPSRIAAAAMWLAYRALSTAPATPSMLASTVSRTLPAIAPAHVPVQQWTARHVQLSGYREVDLLPVAEALFDLVRQPEQHPAIYAKFSTQSRWYAAPWMKQCGVRNVLATVQKQ